MQKPGHTYIRLYLDMNERINIRKVLSTIPNLQTNCLSDLFSSTTFYLLILLYVIRGTTKKHKITSGTTTLSSVTQVMKPPGVNNMCVIEDFNKS